MLGERLAGGGQHLVADLAAVTRVDDPEAVDVDDGDAEDVAVPARALELELDVLGESVRAGQSGDRVLLGRIGERMEDMSAVKTETVPCRARPELVEG